MAFLAIAYVKNLVDCLPKVSLWLCLLLFSASFTETAYAEAVRGSILEAPDVDIQRMVRRGIFSDEFKPEYSSESFVDERGLMWRFQKIWVEGAERPVFFIPHDEEDEAFKAAAFFMKQNRRGTIVALECGERRSCAIMTTRTGWTRSANINSPTDANLAFCMTSFADKVFSYFAGQNPVIALHNNLDGGESLNSISARVRNRMMLGSHRTGDPDDFVLYNAPHVLSGLHLEFHNFLERRNINEIHEYTQSINDCSMSFAASARGLFYFNIETQSGAPRSVRVQLNLINLTVQWFDAHGKVIPD